MVVDFNSIQTKHTTNISVDCVTFALVYVENPPLFMTQANLGTCGPKIHIG